MKKQILTAAVAAAIVLPTLAQAGVYGRADGVVRYFDRGATDAWDVGVDKMRWGIVGSEDLGNGMKALYHYEWDMWSPAGSVGENGSTGPGERTRLAYAGLQGGWGKLTIGRNWINSYFAVWNKTDLGDAHASGPTNLSGNRSGNLVQYTMPNMNGFTASLDLNMDDGDTSFQNSDGVDWWEFSGQYKNGPLQVGVAYRDAELGAAGCSSAAATPTCNEYDQWGIAGAYTWGDLTLEGHFGNRDTDGAIDIIVTGTTSTTISFDGNDDRDVWALGATYKMGANQVYGGYRNSDSDLSAVGLSGNIETDDWFIGVRHFMSKETRVFAEYRQTETDISGSDGVDTINGNVENDMFALGLRKDWKL